MIVTNNSGFSVPPDSPEAFADALESAADDRISLKQSGRNSLVLAQREFDRDSLADIWFEWVTKSLHF